MTLSFPPLKPRWFAAVAATMLISTAGANTVPTSAGLPAGTVEFAIGNVVALGADGIVRSLTKGDLVLSGDRITTQTGRLQIRFSDGAYVSLLPQSDFRVEDYRYAGQTDGSETGFYGLVRGAMRIVTGAIGRVNRARFQINTPTATIGVRGTGGIIEVDEDGATRLTGTSGIWTLANISGFLTVPAGSVGVTTSDRTLPPRLTTHSATPAVLMAGSTASLNSQDQEAEASNERSASGAPNPTAQITTTQGGSGASPTSGAVSADGSGSATTGGTTGSTVASASPATPTSPATTTGTGSTAGSTTSVTSTLTGGAAATLPSSTTTSGSGTSTGSVAAPTGSITPAGGITTPVVTAPTPITSGTATGNTTTGTFTPSSAVVVPLSSGVYTATFAYGFEERNGNTLTINQQADTLPSTQVSMGSRGEVYQIGGMSVPSQSNPGIVSEFGNDGIVGWGRWQRSVDGIGIGPGSNNGEGQGLHYIVGTPTVSMPTANPGNAFATYELRAGNATAPTIAGTSVLQGTLSSAKMAVSFADGRVGLDLNTTFSGLQVRMTTAGGVEKPVESGIRFTVGQPNFAGSFANVTITGTPPANFCQTGASCVANAQGFFAGSQASRAAFVYQATSASSPGNAAILQGAAVMQRTQ